MPQLAVGRLEPLGTVGDDQLEALDVALERTGVLPLAAERARALQDLDRLEGLLDHDELVGVPEPREELQPVVVGVGGADDDLHVRIDHPQVLDGLQPIPARGHPHVHESDRVGTALRKRRARELDAIASLQRRVDVEDGTRDVGWGRTEQSRLGRRLLSVALAREDLAVVRVNRRVVVDDENPVAKQVRFSLHHSTPGI